MINPLPRDPVKELKTQINSHRPACEAVVQARLVDIAEDRNQAKS
jgi:hypothetical protein